jgi:hypothetical protein
VDPHAPAGARDEKGTRAAAAETCVHWLRLTIARGSLDGEPRLTQTFVYAADRALDVALTVTSCRRRLRATALPTYLSSALPRPRPYLVGDAVERSDDAGREIADEKVSGTDAHVPKKESSK